MDITFTRSCDRPHAGLFTLDIKVFLHPDILSAPAADADAIARAALVRMMAAHFSGRLWDAVYVEVGGAWFRATKERVAKEDIVVVEPFTGLDDVYTDFDRAPWWEPDRSPVLI